MASGELKLIMETIRVAKTLCCPDVAPLKSLVLKHDCILMDLRRF